MIIKSRKHKIKLVLIFFIYRKKIQKKLAIPCYISEIPKNEQSHNIEDRQLAFKWPETGHFNFRFDSFCELEDVVNISVIDTQEPSKNHQKMKKETKRLSR